MIQKISFKRESKNFKHKEIKANFLEWVNSITIHSIPNIFRTKFISLKVIWTVAFLISSSLCFYSIVQSVLNYLKYEVNTKIRVIDQQSLVLPAITICNTNPYVTNSSLEYVKRILADNNITDLADTSNSSLFTSSFPSQMNQITLNYILGKHLVSLNSKDKNITDEMRKSFGLPYEKFFISCFINIIDCNQDEWIWYFDVIYGNCFKYNTGYDSKGNKIPLKKLINLENTVDLC